MTSESRWVIETTDDTFDQDVIERSKDVPVAVDFWAQWCAPCRALAPLLEKIVSEFDGKIILAKANTEQFPQTAARFRIQGIPAVLGFRDGEVRDLFVGLLPEAQIKSWFQGMLPTEAEQHLKRGIELAGTNRETAEQEFREAVRIDPDLAKARVEPALLLLAQHRLTECSETLDVLERRQGFLDPSAGKVRAELELTTKAQELGSVDECRSALTANPGDPKRKLELAEALAAAGQYQEALKTSLELVQDHKQQFGEPARQMMVDVFELLPNDSEVTNEYRRKLASALY